MVWKDHEFSTGVLDENQIGWDWFSLQFDNGTALMLFQLRESGGITSDSFSATLIEPEGFSRSLKKNDFSITVLDRWRSEQTGGLYPSLWDIKLTDPRCELIVQPLMANQEISFPAVTYWEGAVNFTGSCEGRNVGGKGYVELTGYAGNLPLP